MLPDQASTAAPWIDNIYFYLIGFSLVATVLIVALIIVFSVRYRRGKVGAESHHDKESWGLEAIWIVLPLIIILIAFGWGARVFVDVSLPPEDAKQIDVVGKQWMWHVRHPGGRREIDELHVPRGTPVQVNLSSEDVIHSFFIPAFRVKQDAVPGRFTSLWFEATETGEYHLFCAEYCGTDHSRMIGRVVVMEPAEYERWLLASDDPLASAGEELFQEKRCVDCHTNEPDAVGPDLFSRFGEEIEVEGEAEPVRFDRDHLRRSVLDPRDRVAAGYPEVMPTFRGRISDRDIIELAAFIEAQAEER